MKKPIQLVAASLILLVFTGCGVSVRVTPFAPGPHSPRPAETPVRMFSTKTPECSYEELGILRVEPKSGLTPWQRVVDAFLARARQMGGDGVILRKGVELRASGEGDVVSDDVLSGTVIRFENPACNR